MTDENIVSSTEIPAVPQFLLRDTDHHVLQAMAGRDQTSTQTNSSQDEEAAALPPAKDLSSINLFANEATGTTAEPGEVSPLAARPSASGSIILKSAYSLNDLALFNSITGYRLDSRAPIWRAIDDQGNRVPIADRIFTTLAEEAFRLADRQHHCTPRPDLTIEDLMMVMTSIRRASVMIGSRGVAAFERLEERVKTLKHGAVGDTLPDFLNQAAPTETVSATV